MKDINVENINNDSIKDRIYINDDADFIPYTQENPIIVTLEEINSLNIVINDDDCREDFINSVCEQLDRDGINFRYAKKGESIDINNAVIITLDQQYMAGPATIVFAPLENNRLGNSDALALAARTSLYEKGILIDGIACGQIGFEENKNGTISERVPTATENKVSSNNNSSFITISFGTQNIDSNLTATSIENTLARYYSYINNDYCQDDLIYCVESGEDYNVIAEKLNSSSNLLDEYNHTFDEKVLLTGETIINPKVRTIREFDKYIPIKLSSDKKLWSK